MLMNQGSARFHRLVRIKYRWEFLISYLDQIEGFLGGPFVCCRNSSNPVPDETNFIHSQCRLIV